MGEQMLGQPSVSGFAGLTPARLDAGRRRPGLRRVGNAERGCAAIGRRVTHLSGRSGAPWRASGPEAL